MKKKLFAKTASVLLLALPSVAYAQTPEPITSFGQVVNFINRIAGIFFGLIIAIAVIMLLYAAFLYLTAAGNPDRTNRAKDILIYGIVGIAVAIVAGGVTSIIGSLFGVDVD